MLDKSDIIVPSRRGFLAGLTAIIAAPAVIRVAKLMPIKVYPEEIPVPFVNEVRPMVPLSRYTLKLERLLLPGDRMAYHRYMGPLGGFVEDNEVSGLLGDTYKETLVVSTLNTDMTKEFAQAIDLAYEGGLVNVGGEDYRVQTVTREPLYHEFNTIAGGHQIVPAMGYSPEERMRHAAIKT